MNFIKLEKIIFKESKTKKNKSPYHCPNWLPLHSQSVLKQIIIKCKWSYHVFCLIVLPLTEALENNLS